MPVEDGEAEQTNFPADYLRRMQALEPAYLQHDDPIRQSGFGGGPERWRQERGQILAALLGSGELLDVGCANGYLLECLCQWAARRGIKLEPHGVDLGPELIKQARARFPGLEQNFHCANAWDWRPLRHYLQVYALHDCVPPALLAAWTQHMLEHFVAPGGRLIIGAYGSNSRQTAATDVEALLASAGMNVSGRHSYGELPILRLVWLDRKA